MPRNYKLGGKLKLKEPRVAVRMVLGVLVAANIVAALILLKPWGGSAEDLIRQEQALRQQVSQLQARVSQTKQLVNKVEQARQAGDHFLEEFTLERRAMSSAILAELDKSAKEAGIKTRERTFVIDPVEGSDTLSQMTITAGYEGNYQSLTKFVNLLDKSSRFLIIEQMQAAPEQGTQLLNVSFKLDTFVRDVPGSAS